MELTWHTLVWLPIGLGLLGFIEPCTVGGHLLFLDTQADRVLRHRLSAATTFSFARSLVTSGFGATIGIVGQALVSIQTGIWIVFGLIYLVIGTVFLLGRSALLKWNLDLAPSGWKKMQNPLVLGVAFGLNIPACAAPILFGLLAIALSTGTVLSGFMMMFVFGLAMSMPLILIAAVPDLSKWLVQAGEWMKQRTWLIGLTFVLLGAWSIWFGLFVDPQNWSGR